MFEQDPYVSLRTFRKSGVAVDTPVWCAVVDAKIYIFSAGDAGKVKRLRNADRTEIATCDARGGNVGVWHNARAVIFEDPSEIAVALGALRNKYGWQMLFADWGAKITGRYQRRAYIRAELT